jgi:hypothetical protein
MKNSMWLVPPIALHSCRPQAHRLQTRKLDFINIAVEAEEPSEVEIPILILKMEGTSQLMSGVNQLNCRSAGEQPMSKLLKRIGFPETRLLFWKRNTSLDGSQQDSGRVMTVRAREPERLGRAEYADHQVLCNTANLYPKL